MRGGSMRERGKFASKPATCSCSRGGSSREGISREGK